MVTCTIVLKEIFLCGYITTIKKFIKNIISYPRALCHLHFIHIDIIPPYFYIFHHVTHMYTFSHTFDEARYLLCCVELLLLLSTGNTDCFFADGEGDTIIL